MVTFSVASVCVSVFPVWALIFECLDLLLSFSFDMQKVECQRHEVKVKITGP